MADVTTSQIYDGARHVQVKLTNVSDGTGQAAAVVVNVSTLNPNPGTHLKIRRIRYAISGMSVRLLWDASAPVDMAVLGQGEDILDFSKEFAGGMPNNGGAGVTGNILLTTIGQANGSTYTIFIDAIKGV